MARSLRWEAWWTGSSVGGPCLPVPAPPLPSLPLLSHPPQPPALRFREVPGSALTPKRGLWFQPNPGGLASYRAVLWVPG